MGKPAPSPIDAMLMPRMTRTGRQRHPADDRRRRRRGSGHLPGRAWTAGNASFETTAPTGRRSTRARLPAHRLVAVDDAGAVLGWVGGLRGVRPAPVYAGVVEHSVYVDPAARGRGVGRALLDALIASTEAAGIWTIQSGVFPENTASLALHRRRRVPRPIGIRERVGRHHQRQPLARRRLHRTPQPAHHLTTIRPTSGASDTLRLMLSTQE